jgi:hypothetical protein
VVIEYVTALYLTAAACATILGCYVLPPGQGYQSLTPTQHPNWCVINKGIVASGAMLAFPEPIRSQLLMGPGVKPCGIPRGRIEPPKPMS